MILLVLLGLIGGSSAILCYDDIELDDVQEYTYELEKKPLDKYWSKYVKPAKNDRGEEIGGPYNMHLTYFMFGKFVGDPSDATITAGYYKEDDSLIYSVKVDCGARTWTSYAPNSTEEFHQKGELENSCVDGEIFDVILKVQQPHLMSWLFDGQPLQHGNQTTNFTRKGITTFRDRTLSVPSFEKKGTGGAADAARFKIQTTGAAVVTRLAFGRCIAWPEEITRNCTAVNEWIVKRSKSKTVGQGRYGFTVPTLLMDCYKETLYMWLQPKIHPDEDSIPESAYCCCVDMETGKLWSGDRDVDCQSSKACEQTCVDAFNPDFFEA